jgi:hypothetical protein
VSLREDVGNGQFGPEILQQPSMEYELYFPDLLVYATEKRLELAEQYDLYLKLVLMDKNDKIYYKLDDDGTFVIGGESDNQDGFYGLGREMNKTRWLQAAWYRYLQARWGYSPHIHSWELTNEGDPFLQKHWEMTDELGKFMHCRVFGVPVESGDGKTCAHEHPNRHMVTTSFWHSFPGYSAKSDYGFWGNPNYPNVDYADGHAYISSSPASLDDKLIMEKDAAYYHLWHSREWGGWGFDFPVVRGEAGMVPAQGSTDAMYALGIQEDSSGIWYHNYLWSGLDSGALYEIYWYFEDHIKNLSTYDHRHHHKSFAQFLAGIPLNNGHYEAMEPVSSSPDLRIVGQKDLVNGNAHLWVQNLNHTWRNVVDGVASPPVSATVAIEGFEPSKPYGVEMWDTYETDIDAQVVESFVVVADTLGMITLSVSNLETDVAFKILSRNAIPQPEEFGSVGGVVYEDMNDNLKYEADEGVNDVLIRLGDELKSTSVEIPSYEATTTSGSDGSFRFERVPAGEYTLTVTPPGSATQVQSQKIEVTTNAMTTIEPIAIPHTEKNPHVFVPELRR